MPELDYRKGDQQLWDEEFESFVPERIYDAHAHLFDPKATAHLAEKPRIRECTDLAIHREWAKRIYPNREVQFLFLGTPIVGIDVDLHNQFVISETRKETPNRCHVLVTPDVTPEQLAGWLKQPQVQGIKPYRTFSVTGDIDDCRITDFFPEHLLEVADQYGAWITLHLSRLQGCADEENLRDLEEFTRKKYPNIRWILAHCARNFTYHGIRRAIDQLEDLPNITYDLSAVTDMRPMLTLLQKAKLERILWGADGVNATYFHGAYAPMGRSWVLLRETDLPPIRYAHCADRPTLVVYESLLAFKHATEIAGLGSVEIEAIFYSNAVRHFGIQRGE